MWREKKSFTKEDKIVQLDYVMEIITYNFSQMRRVRKKFKSINYFTSFHLNFFTFLSPNHFNFHNFTLR